jgi:hypothetical protein
LILPFLFAITPGKINEFQLVPLEKGVILEIVEHEEVAFNF